MHSTFAKARRATNHLTRWTNYLGAAALALMVLHITIDVVMRYFFNSPLTSTIEIVSAYYMVAVIALPLAYVHLRNEHIRVELFTTGLSPTQVHRMDTAVEVLLLMSFAALAALSFEEALSKTAINEVWESGQGLIPVWPARWTLVIGFGFATLVSLSRLLSSFGGDDADGDPSA
ncbi:MAG TPA: TRAP transporter small permease [Maritimibacter sp.]|nr:TRAP transporter small permease [Maritimibacter sp.]